MQAVDQKTNDIADNSYTKLYGAPEGHDARILADRARQAMADDRIVMHIAIDDARIATLKDLMAFFAPDVKLAVFPAWDCLPYDRVSPNNEIVAQRVAALAECLNWQKQTKRQPRVVLTTINAVTQRVPPKSVLDTASLIIQKNGRIQIEQLQQFFLHNGYVRTDTVREAGEFAIRGGIIDLFPPGYEDPVRVDLFGDDVETLRSFDALTQRTIEDIDHLSLYPATEFILSDDAIAKFRSQYRERYGVIRDDDPLYEAVSSGRRYNGMDHWLPLFYDGLDTLFDFVPDAQIFMDQHAEQARIERLSQIEDFYQTRKTLEQAAIEKKDTVSYRPLPVDDLYIEHKEWQQMASNSVVLLPFRSADTNTDEAKKGRDFADIRALPDGDVFDELAKYVSEHRNKQRKILIACYTGGSRDRLIGMMENTGFANLKPVKTFADYKKMTSHDTGFALLPLEHGFVSDDLIVITEQDILGDRIARKAKKKKQADHFLTEVSSLSEGDFIVHVDHGIGKFMGLETVEAAGARHDCLKLVYAGDDKLFVPVENMDVLTRFGGEDTIVQLDKLGGAGWQARKAKVKKDLMAIADDLLKIAAERQLRKAEPLRVDQHVYQEFSSRFPYRETEDQLRCINETLDSMAENHPMDRLVCGDVGFGKTEVAIRAAYVAAMNGAQVAVIVPTTLLARQHYENFLQRFTGTGIRVEQLSRLVTSTESKKIKERLADGESQIVIGTHALLAKDVRFAHLGLVIVDEEQRFGVKQKEKLKELKTNVHILTLTATPIPRTLQLALTGVRDLSLITTPPVDRLAIRTFVLPYDPMVIREGIMREKYRGGQVFYVCPRIKDMNDLEKDLKELVPEASIVTAHGQMPATELEDRMTAFYDGAYDILLATNIIESGIDIPTANTMVVHRADMFGLAQLYQIRGRIGRSKLRAYAYLTYDPKKKLTDQAQKRLEVIETLDTLGAGFQLASHDMEIRGAGNLLGDQQSGHIKEVGVELYQQMLEEAVAAAREGLSWSDEDKAAAEAQQKSWTPQINLGISVLIPERYVEDLSVRMGLYRRLSDIETKEDIEIFAAELIDRFGPIPDEVENLLEIIEIKQLSKQAGIDHVEAGPKGGVIGFYENQPPNVEGLMAWVQDKMGTIKLRHDQKLVAVREWHTPTKRVEGIRILVRQLAKLVAN